MPHIAHDGIETYYAEQGRGTPLLLIHGAEADHTMFDRLVPLLATHWRCLAYDQRDSGKTQNGTAEYSIEQLADDAASFVAALGLPRAHVFGTSLGSVVAQHLAVRHPGRVNRLVLSSAIRAGRLMTEFAPETAARLAVLRADPIKNADALAAHFFPAAYLKEHPGLFASLRSPRTEAQSARRAGLLRRSYALDIATIASPTLVLAGAEDGLIPPSHSLSIADEINGAARHVLEGVGHVGSVQAPAETAEILNAFLSGGNER